MIRSKNTNEMFRFLIKSFEPSYVIHLTQKNKITNFDKKLIADFNIKVTDYEDLLGMNISDFVNGNGFDTSFADTLTDIINNRGTGLCAINTSLKYNTIKIPAIYILFAMLEEKTVAGNVVKELQIYNYVEVAKFLSKVLHGNMFEPFTQLTKSFQNDIQEKSLFFAFESLKYFATFISSENATKTNKQQLADVVYPFHRHKTTEINPRFIDEFLRSTDGYVEYDKNRQIKKSSVDTLEYLADKNFVPFNSLDKNRIIKLS